MALWELHYTAYHFGSNPFFHSFRQSDEIPYRTIARHLQIILNKLFNDGIDPKNTKERIVIHSLRHTFASHLAVGITPIYVIQKLMNHADIEMTMRYAKLSPDSGTENVRSLYQ